MRSTSNDLPLVVTTDQESFVEEDSQTSFGSSIQSFLKNLWREGAGEPSSWQPSAHTRLIDRFELLEEIGRGGMGCVWRSYDHTLHRMVAIKILHNQKAHHNTPRLQQELKEEAHKLAQVKNDALVQVYDYSIHHETAFIVQEYLEGHPLHAWLTQPELRALIDLPLASSWLSQTLQTLGEIHEKQLIHRDITPKNLFILHPSHRLKVLDLGLAMFQQDFFPDASPGSKLARRAGTHHYWAPEQAQGQDQREYTDIYGAGKVFEKVLQACLENTKPYRLSQRLTLALLRRTLSKATQEEPSLRYPHVHAWRQDLQRIQYLVLAAWVSLALALLLTLLSFPFWSPAEVLLSTSPSAASVPPSAASVPPAAARASWIQPHEGHPPSLDNPPFFRSTDPLRRKSQAHGYYYFLESSPSAAKVQDLTTHQVLGETPLLVKVPPQEPLHLRISTPRHASTVKINIHTPPRSVQLRQIDMSLK